MSDELTSSEALAKRVSELEAENHSLRAEVTALSQQVAELEYQLEEPPNNAGDDDLEVQVAELEAENEALRNEADDLDRQCAELEDQLEVLSIEARDDEGIDPAQLAELEAEVEALSHANAELEAELDTLGQAHAELELELDVAGTTGAGVGLGAGSDEERVYVGSMNRRHFHRPGCKWAEHIPDYLLIEFGSHREAVEANYRPCKTCRA